MVIGLADGEMPQATIMSMFPHIHPVPKCAANITIGSLPVNFSHAAASQLNFGRG